MPAISIDAADGSNMNHVAMKTRTIVLFVGLLSIVAGSLQAAPKIVVTNQPFTFGKIVQHAVANHRFWIKSVGSSPAKIIEAVPDCGCTDIILKDSTVAPGDSIPLDIVFHSRAFMGLLVKKPSIKIQGSDEKTIAKFFAEVVIDPARTSPLVITPGKVDVSQFGEKTRRKGTFTVLNNSIHDYTIKVVDSSVKSFTVIMPPVIKAGAQIVGEISVKKDKVPTSFEEAFTFEITDAEQSRYTVSVARLYNPKKESSTATSGS